MTISLLLNGCCGQEIGRQRRLVGVVVIVVRLRRHARIVRTVGSEVAEERLVAGLLLDEIDRGVGEQFHRVLAADPLVLELVVGADVLEREFVGVAHAAEEDGMALLEGAEDRLGAVVPFTGDEGGVPGLAELLGPGGLAFELVVDAEERAAGHEHGPRRHADGAAGAAHDVGAAEHGAGLREPVELRRADVVVAERVDRVEPLVVAEQEEDIWFRGLGRLARQRAARPAAPAAERRGR